MRNLPTDVPGILVGNARDARAATGVNLLEPEMTRGVYEATALPYKTAVPDWKTRFGGGRR